jgi:hypothetical protein
MSANLTVASSLNNPNTHPPNDIMETPITTALREKTMSHYFSVDDMVKDARDTCEALEQRLRIAEDALNEVLKDSRDPQIEDITFRRLQMSEVRGALAQIQAIKLP